MARPWIAASRCVAVIATSSGGNNPIGGSLGRPYDAWDGNGRDELAMDVTSAAAIGLVEFYRVDPDGIRVLVIADPGDPPLVRPGPAILGGGFDSGLQSPIVCRVNENGTRGLTRSTRRTSAIVSVGHGRSPDDHGLDGERLVVMSTGDSQSSFPETTGIPSFSKTSPFENGCS